MGGRGVSGAMSWSRGRGHGAGVEGMGAIGFKSSDRGMGPRGHGKRAWRGRVCGWWQPCETCQNIHVVWVVGAMWDHGAMSHRCQGVEGMGPCDGHGKGAWGSGG